MNIGPMWQKILQIQHIYATLIFLEGILTISYVTLNSISFGSRVSKSH